MIRFFIFLLFIISFVDARENPFFPSDGEVDMIITSNQVKKTIPIEACCCYITF